MTLTWFTIGAMMMVEGEGSIKGWGGWSSPVPNQGHIADGTHEVRI